MTERLLQFIWQFQYFNHADLTSVAGDPLQVIFPGQFNTNQGPDFSHSKIIMGDTAWAGSVEIHINTSDWDRHQHGDDKNYNNVVLHVVWNHDVQPNNIPVLELSTRVPKLLLQQYEEWMVSKTFVPCENSIAGISSIIWKAWKERLLAERLLRKTVTIQEYLRQNKNHWEETFWWLLARNFGMTVNADAFEAMARVVPLKIIARDKQQLHRIESLLFGQAGLLEGDFVDEYAKLLQREYRYTQKKYGLRPITIPVHLLRMRPGNFPTIRLAQLAMVLHGSTHLFAAIREAKSLEEIRRLFDVTANDYWHYHYRFDEASKFRKKTIGPTMITNIFINTIAPMLFAYGEYYSEQSYKDKAIDWLLQLEAESNMITRGFERFGINSKTAYDSQALIELKSQYCDRKRCLDCGVGNKLLREKV